MRPNKQASELLENRRARDLIPRQRQTVARVVQAAAVAERATETFFANIGPFNTHKFLQSPQKFNENFSLMRTDFQRIFHRYFK